jgi:hypothetical protein
MPFPAAQRFPDFFIIGAMKCGTSTLHDQLAMRSGLFMSEPKEPNFFSNDELVRRGTEAYLTLFEDALDEQLCGESSTHYTKLPTYPNTIANLTRHVGDARFIYVIRDPVERMSSQYVHEWTQREVDVPYARAVREIERYVAYSSYARQLEPFLRHFGAERVQVVFFERLVAYPAEELARVCAFLKDPSREPVVWDAASDHRNVSSERMRKSPLRESLLKIPAVKSIKDRLPPSVREQMKGIWRMRSRPELDSRSLEWVRGELNRDLGELGRWLGRDLSCENFKAQALASQAEWSAPPQKCVSADS